MNSKKIRKILLNYCFHLFSGFVLVLPPPLAATELDRIDGNKIYFKQNSSPAELKSVDTQLFELKHLGELRPSEESHTQYFLFEGKPCERCNEERGLFVIRPNGSKPIAFTYPGKTFEPKSRALLHESRAFYGRCLKDKGDVLVFFQLEHVDRKRHLQPSVLIAEPAEDHLSENLVERHLPKITHTLKLVKKKQCIEIIGSNRLMPPKSINLHQRTPASH